MTDARGAALLDILVASALCLTMAAIAVPVIGGTLDRERTIIGAQYLAGQLQRARLESLKQARSVAVRLEIVGERTRLQLFADGNGNGVLQRDIDRAIDPPLTPPEYLDDRSRDVSLRINQPVVDVSGAGQLDPGDDPLRIGNTALLDVQSAGRRHERNVICGGSPGTADGDSCIRSDRPCPRVDVRCAGAAMAALTDRWSDRRAEQRVAGERLRWRANAVLRPGQPVVLLNISSRAALVESDARLRPGAHTELQLHASAGDARTTIRGRLDRCHVAALEPLRYRGVLIFDQRVDLDDGNGGRE